MSNFFDPTNAKQSGQVNETPSPAAQALIEFRMKMLGRMLDSAAGPRQTFSQFAGGAPLTPRLPGGLSAGIPELLQAMSQPGAFTSNKSFSGTQQPPGSSPFSDVAGMAALAAILYDKGVLGAGATGIGNILKYLGGAKGINGVNSALGDFSPDVQAGTALNSNMQDALGAVGGAGEVPLASAGSGNDDLLSAILGFAGY